MLLTATLPLKLKPVHPKQALSLRLRWFRTATLPLKLKPVCPKPSFVVETAVVQNRDLAFEAETGSPEASFVVEAQAEGDIPKLYALYPTKTNTGGLISKTGA